MGISSAILSDAVCLTQDNALSQILKSVLRSKGISNILLAASSAEAREGLERFPNSLLVVHWTSKTSSDAALTLADAQGKNKLDLRPVLLVAPELSSQVVATAMEFSVTQIHVGELDGVLLSQKIGTVLRTVAPSRLMKNMFKKVDKLRQNHQLAEAGKLLQEALASQQKNMRIRSELAENFFLEEKFEECLEVLSPLAHLNPPYLRALNIRARCLVRMGKGREAMDLLQKAKLFNPHNTERLCELGELLFTEGEVAGAEANFDEALELEPENKQARVGKGKCLLMEEQVNEALEMVRDVTNRGELASMFNISAILSVRRGAHGQGLRLYDAALRALGDNPVLTSRLMFNKGLGYRRMKKEAEAKKCFQEALKLDPKYEKAKVSLQEKGPAPVVGEEFVEETLAPSAVSAMNPSVGDDAEDYAALRDDLLLGGDTDEESSSGF